MDHPFAKRMACPFNDQVCSSRIVSNSHKDSVAISTTGKSQTLKPHQPLRKKQLCYYEVSGGKDGELAKTDDYLIFQITSLSDVKLSVMIAEKKTSDFMDLCENLSVGDTLFARVPYKFFPIFEASNWNGDYAVSMFYTKSANLLSKTANKGKCKRVANRKNGYD